MEGTLSVPKDKKGAAGSGATTEQQPLAVTSTAEMSESDFNAAMAKTVRIFVQKGDGDDEKDGIYVGINAQRDYVVPRDVEVEVPIPVYEVLRNAKRISMSEDGSRVSEISRFAVSVVGGVPSLRQ